LANFILIINIYLTPERLLSRVKMNFSLKFCIAILFFFSLIFALDDHNPLDDIENHDQFNLADVDGIGFDRLELEMKKRKIAVPKFMQQ
jgi:hypothetical protein